LAMVTIIIRENKSIQEENYIYFWFILWRSQNFREWAPTTWMPWGSDTPWTSITFSLAFKQFRYNYFFINIIRHSFGPRIIFCWMLVVFHNASRIAFLIGSEAGWVVCSQFCFE
jgi:hypothetical protein